MNGKTCKAAAPERTRKALWASALAVSVLLLLLLGLAAVLFDLFAHDLLCRYGMTRWDPDERACYVPLPEP